MSATGFRKIKLFTISILLLVLSGQASSQGPAKQHPPKLVVGIVVDQMRYDYLTRYWNKFGDGGFKKLVNEGYLCTNTQFNYIPTFTAPGHASIYSGTSPSVHGIIGNDWYSREARQLVYCAGDLKVKGIGSNSSDGMMSPKNILVTTVTDELRIASNFRSKVIGISLKDRGAIFPAGRTANAAYWNDTYSGKWISSSWYMNALPEWVNKINAENRADKILNTVWNPLLPIDQYTESTTDTNRFETIYPGQKNTGFPHFLIADGVVNYERLRDHPSGDTFTKDFALTAMKEENLGKDEFTDFLCISFSATDYVGHDYGTHAIETEDVFLRVDKDIEDLIKQVEEWAGKENVVFFLTSDHGVAYNSAFSEYHKLPAGALRSQTMRDTVKSFLTKKYGTTGIYSSIYKNNVYLNKDSLAAKGLSMEEVTNKLREFILSIDGIADVITSKDLMSKEYTKGMRDKVQNGFNYSRSGDLIYIIQPGNVDYPERGTEHGSGYNYDSHVPLIFYGSGIPKGSTAREISIIDIAPTLSQLLNISYPSASSGKVITEILNK